MEIDPRYKYKGWVEKYRGYPKKIEEAYNKAGDFETKIWGLKLVNGEPKLLLNGEPKAADYAKVKNMINY